MPFNKDSENGGTEVDGLKSKKYCSYWLSKWRVLITRNRYIK